MKIGFASTTVLACLTGGILAILNTIRVPEPTFARIPNKTKTIIGCSPNMDNLSRLIEELNIPPIPGSGSYVWKLNTDSDSAQFYFNQGINTYYSFHIIESLASFKKAAAFDSSNALIYWAQALAYGPNINDVAYSTAPAALEATAKAMELSPAVSEKEKMLINAISVRYSGSPDIDQNNLNGLYVQKMKEVYNKFPTDADIAALYADALMIQHPWDLWSHDGTPKPWTPEIRQVLEKLLKHTPQHPGANHYYIHVMEASPFAEKAVASADRLGKLTPGLSHTLHMPSHIYLQTGHYQRGISVNEQALESYQVLTKLYAPVTANDFLYSIHNRHMLVNNAMLAGNSALALKSSLELAQSIPEEYLQTSGAMGNYLQYIYMTPVLARVRFANWDTILTMQKPANHMIYANLLYHWGRGMAYANTSRIAEASEELGLLNNLLSDSSLLEPFTPFSAAIDGAVITQNLLMGSIAEKTGNYADAIRNFSKAVEVEAGMVYNEPRDWMLSPAHFLGQAYLQDKQFRNAANTFSRDLLTNRDNPWALAGLYQARSALGEASAKMLRSKLKKATIGADIEITKAVL